MRYTCYRCLPCCNQNREQKVSTEKRRLL
jgi:hypothetical protein